MRILDDGIEVDFNGTSGLSARGINVPPAYCRAYACFGIKCVVAPDLRTVTAFEFKVGAEIPRSEWAEHFLTLESGPTD